MCTHMICCTMPDWSLPLCPPGRVALPQPPAELPAQHWREAGAAPTATAGHQWPGAEKQAGLCLKRFFHALVRFTGCRWKPSKNTFCAVKNKGKTLSCILPYAYMSSQAGTLRLPLRRNKVVWAHCRHGLWFGPAGRAAPSGCEKEQGLAKRQAAPRAAPTVCCPCGAPATAPARSPRDWHIQGDRRGGTRWHWTSQAACLARVSRVPWCGLARGLLPGDTAS